MSLCLQSLNRAMYKLTILFTQQTTTLKKTNINMFDAMSDVINTDDASINVILT